MSECAGPKSDYLKIYEELGEQVAKRMNGCRVKEYAVYNGEMVKYPSLKWESCSYVPKDGEEIFKKTLEKYLK